ncbi:MAG: zinc ABC transporter ATP-binding protein ZnuC [Burkholderiales bacterium]|nr:zinc ABC transporter ATP-binding protein ZnuC [Burkholderiales bacterium]
MARVPPDAASGARALVSAHGIGKRFGGRAVLSDIDVTIARGEIVSLIGPNGAGKTTLLRVLLGLLAPDAGTVERTPGLRVGYMPQRLTIDDLLPLPVRRFLELGRPRSAAQIAAVLEEVGVARVVDSPVQGLSGGELRRVLLARALLRDPELLALDEPAQGVDVSGQGDLFRLIIGIRERRGCGVLMVSHDMHLVMAATDTVLCLNNHLCCTGHPEVVSQHPEYLALFGPHDADALALYTHRHDHRHDGHGRVIRSDERGEGIAARNTHGHG